MDHIRDLPARAPVKTGRQAFSAIEKVIIIVGLSSLLWAGIITGVLHLVRSL